MLERAYDNFIVPLETFRKDQVGQVKERKKKFDKQTAKFCASQERYLGLSTKKQDNVLQEVRRVYVQCQRYFANGPMVPFSLKNPLRNPPKVLLQVL